MTRYEHLFIKIHEEFAELEQAVCKAALFGLESGHPDNGTNNLQDINREFNDLVASLELALPGLLLKIDDSAVYAKKNKIEKWIKHSDDVKSGIVQSSIQSAIDYAKTLDWNK